MEKVLLAIDGTTPDQKAFKYAVDLCMRIKADLKVLQVVSPQDFGGYISKIKTKANKAKRFIEESMMAATFAEAGEHETASAMMEEAERNLRKLLPESARAGVTCDLLVRSGDTTKEIVNYVRDNKDIVIAVYDAPRGNDPKSSARKIKNDLKSITKGLTIPVVMVQAET
ncbi:MAG: universal stress protein [Proteobacteria bacterium]|nr:universal stress protein [Pseudomonadota bacterium]MBU1714833.1 universal stress protein [Pseudomonadota bacterium]